MSNSSSTFLLARINKYVFSQRHSDLYRVWQRNLSCITSVHLERNSHISSVRLRDYRFWLFIPSCLWGLMAVLNPLCKFLSLCTKYVEAILNIKHGVIVKRESWNQFPTLKTRSTKDGTVTVSKGFKVNSSWAEFIYRESKVIMKLLL